MAGSTERALRRAPVLLALAFASPVAGQSTFVLSRITITIDGDTTYSEDATAMITNAPAKGRVVLHDRDGVQVGAWVRANTHHTSSGRNGGAGVVIVLDLAVYGQREKRELGRVFRPDEEREVRISEKFKVRTGQGPDRRITVAFTGRLE